MIIIGAKRDVICNYLNFVIIYVHWIYLRSKLHSRWPLMQILIMSLYALSGGVLLNS